MVRKHWHGRKPSNKYSLGQAREVGCPVCGSTVYVYPNDYPPIECPECWTKLPDPFA